MSHNRETAYAKINLALHVRSRRDDGYHDIETLFAFLDFGDELWREPAKSFELCSHGEFAGDMGPDESNLITRAARLVHNGELPPTKFNIEKKLPVAAGLGGGSADAAAALRLMGAGDQLAYAEALGADIPACMASVPAIGLGTGAEIHPISNDVQGLACILVNPLVPVPTGPVFEKWDGIDRGALTPGAAQEVMMSGRNDLEKPAIELCPAIADILDHLNDTNPMVARMSGSGASCFAIYDDFDRAARLSFELRENIRQDWWVYEGRLR